MEKRTIRFGDYDTAAHGLWTLTAWEFPEPIPEENLVHIPGRYKGPLDLSTALTDGQPTYGARTLTATFESSEGDRMAREARISAMVNQLHGRRLEIVLPDHPMHYAIGRLKVQTIYNDLAHASVQIIAICEPWIYAKEETVVQLTATAEAQVVRLRNAGAMPVVPSVEVTAEQGATVSLAYNGKNVAVSAGAYMWPDMLLTPGDHVLTYSGTGVATITYREAILR